MTGDPFHINKPQFLLFPHVLLQAMSMVDLQAVCHRIFTLTYLGGTAVAPSCRWHVARVLCLQHPTFLSIRWWFLCSGKEVCDGPVLTEFYVNFACDKRVCGNKMLCYDIILVHTFMLEIGMWNLVFRAFQHCFQLFAIRQMAICHFCWPIVQICFFPLSKVYLASPQNNYIYLEKHIFIAWNVCNINVFLIKIYKRKKCNNLEIIQILCYFINI